MDACSAVKRLGSHCVLSTYPLYPFLIVQEVQIRAPFNVAPTPVYQTGLIFHNNVWKTPNQLVAESNAATESRPVEAQFPVSTGLDHQITEGAADAQTAAQSINVFARFEVGLMCVCLNLHLECIKVGIVGMVWLGLYILSFYQSCSLCQVM